MSPTCSSEDSDLVEELIALEKRSGKLVRSSLYVAPASPNTLVHSWKLNEFKYYDIPSPFPTLARGLFTIDIPKSEAKGSVKHRIVARGYDKFFNIGEVPWTTWEALEAHTAPPYTLSLKSNGCIIFIAPLTPEQIIVTSKHSLGPVQGAPLSHSQAGEQWLRRYLEQKGRSEADLARTLWEHNWTAVAELCDDSFEEHVLAYPPERTGLHLHGINVATKAFKTMPQDVVDAFAEEWGFIRTPTHVVSSIAEVREFTLQVEKAGQWNGEPVEGFVVRTHVTEPPTEGRGTGKTAKSVSKGQSPYAPGSSFFFKVKFDEPYMMYRDWREVTKKLLTTKGPLSPSILPKAKMRRKETQIYVKWVIEEIKKNRKAFENYTKGKGIIATRERFLKYLESDNGKKDVEVSTNEATHQIQGKVEKAIIVPVAIPGCGKTSVAVALAHIFGFGHTQSDDIHAKKSAPLFIKKVVALLKDHDVVIADKNNHLKQHRQQLRDAIAKYSPPVRLIALNWALDKPPAMVHRICSDRVLSRGDNHQTLRADLSVARSHEEVIWKFINTAEELTDQEVDASIEMEVEDDLETSIRKAISGICEELGELVQRPSEDKIKEALKMVGAYVPKTKKEDEKEKATSKTVTPRYFGLLPEVDVEQILEEVFAHPDSTTKDGAQFWKELKETKRATIRPHVTIVHQKSISEEKQVWDVCSKVYSSITPPLFKCKLGRVLWNDRVMVLTVEDISLDAEGGGDPDEGAAFLNVLPDDTRNRLHITVGTAEPGIAPVEGKTLVEKWRNGKRSGIGEAELDKEVVVTGRLKGLMS